MGLTASQAAAQTAFEGVVNMNMQGGGKNTEVRYFVKGTKTRMELQGGEAVMIMDMAAGKMMTVMPPQKMYMVMDMKNVAAMAEKMGGGKGASKADPGAVPPIKPTGAKETIAGYECEHYVVTHDKQDTDICAAKGMGYFGMGGAGAGPMGGFPGGRSGLPKNFEQYASTFSDGFFPLKVETVKGGKREMVLQVTSVEKKALDASLFEPPAGFRKMEMPNFGGR